MLKDMTQLTADIWNCGLYEILKPRPETLNPKPKPQFIISNHAAAPLTQLLVLCVRVVSLFWGLWFLFLGKPDVVSLLSGVEQHETELFSKPFNLQRIPSLTNIARDPKRGSYSGISFKLYFFTGTMWIALNPYCGNLT